MAINPPTPAVMQHVVTFAGFWHLAISWVIGAFMGSGLMSWWTHRGVSGMVADVKSEINVLRTDVNALKVANAPAPSTPAS